MTDYIPNKKPVAAYLFWSGSNRQPISIAIAAVTRPGRFSHTGLIFVLRDPDGNIERVIHEAHIDTGYAEKPLQRLRTWSEKRGNFYEAHALDLTAWELDQLYLDSLSAMQRYKTASGYDGRQLFRLLLWDACLSKMGFSVSDDDRAVVCSEITSRLCRLRGIDLRERQGETFDEATPNSTWRAWMARKGGAVA